MKSPRPWWTRRAIGIAIGSNDATAAFRAGHCSRQARRAGFEDGVAALGFLLADPELHRIARRRGVRIALLPPLAEDRILDLPRLTEDQAERALAVQAARYFAVGSDDAVVAARVVDAASGQVLASIASALLIARIHDVLRKARVRCLGVFPAIPSIFGSEQAPEHRVVIHDGVLICALRRNGRIAALRRVPADSPAAAEILHELAMGEVSLSELGEAAVLAANAVSRGVAGPEFRPMMLRAARARRARLRAGAMVLAASLTIGLALGMEGWHVNRELGRIRSERAAAREAVTAALQERERYDELSASVDRVAMAAAMPPMHALLEAAIAGLPSDLVLDMLEIGGNELVLSGTTSRADAVFSALRSSPLTAEIEWIGAVRSTTGNGMRQESFGIAARLQTGVSER